MSDRPCDAPTALPATAAGSPACPLAVVMPTRNQAEFIAASVQSVFDQGIPGLQLFVQDGASTDGTPALLAELAARHPGLRWVSEPDHGPAEALNRAFARALAETDAPVLGWLNSDDLYTPGAATRALAQLQAHPAQVMVYGEGEHVDGAGAPLGRYPTRPPSFPLPGWRDGCPICQPTVFLRREAVQALDGLDEGLRTAFDFEAWLRLFKAFPGRVGFVPQVQAQSRLHEGAITLRQRETVAMEGLQVVHRHLGAAPAHWLLTHFDEALAAMDVHEGGPPPAARLRALAERALPWLAREARTAVQARLDEHAALRLATPWFFAPVQADGWAGRRLGLQLWPPGTPGALVQATDLAPPGAGPKRPPRHLRLDCRSHAPRGHVLRVAVRGPAGDAAATERVAEVSGPGSFALVLPLSGTGPWPARWQVDCLNPYVPALHEPGSTDRRELTFRLEAATWLP